MTRGPENAGTKVNPDRGEYYLGDRSNLIEKVPQSSGSHWVAADSEFNRIFVPQVAPVAIVGTGGDTTTVGAGICGTNNGCIAVYRHGDGDHDHDHDADAGH
jgi:hypothetical protein